ncbi:MAG: decaprenyl-phosphate phosphoribosyltransferase [FCB group bacterium]|jgi:4-hydroxybenzoate polyprenyltransferase|nr:decaprenyl-phosphate phosphoribosyltransferase [FCB group bacterium]
MGTQSSLKTWIAALRLYQWTKNLLVFAALIFSGQLVYPQQVMKSFLAFAVFCAASSAIYLFNDIMDVSRDRDHPVKRLRPIASGALKSGPVAWVAGLLLAGALALAFVLEATFGAVVVLYALLMLAYSVLLKHVALVDVLTVSSGFVIRAVAGAVVLDVVFTNWLVVCTFFLALFLSLAKRRREQDLLLERATLHRDVHAAYTVTLLDTLMQLAAGSALISYVIYTCSETVIERLGTDKLYLTIPFVVYGLFRYLFLVHHNLSGEDPSRTLLHDRPLIAAVALWSVTCVAVIYGHSILGI